MATQLLHVQWFYNISEKCKWATLTHFQTMFHFYTSLKNHKTLGFLTFSGGIEVEHWLKMG